MMVAQRQPPHPAPLIRTPWRAPPRCCEQRGSRGGNEEGMHPPPTRSPISRSERLNTCAPPENTLSALALPSAVSSLHGQAPGVGERLHAAAGRAGRPMLYPALTAGSAMHRRERVRSGGSGGVRNKALLGRSSAVGTHPQTDSGPLRTVESRIRLGNEPGMWIDGK